MKKDEEDKKTDEELEAELKALIETLSKESKKSKLLSVASFGLHKNFGLNILLMYLVNLLLFMVTSGLTKLLVVDDPLGFFVGVLLFTLLEITIKMMVLRFLLKYVLQSFGLILVLISVLLIYISVDLTSGLYFIGVFDLIGFSILFLVLRFMVNYYIKKHQITKRR
ncbi:MAG TPA: hypothetical protein VJY66_03415 [Acholeplasma sp.]|nr:hypothetical protein [Acholeplasma sp.]